MNQLALRYEYDASHADTSLDRDDFGRLSVAVETDRFSGRGGFWVQWQEIVEFGESLAVYPISAEKPLLVEWGYEMLERDDLIIRIEIGPKDSSGELIARVEVADDHEPWKRVKTSFRTGYPALEMFQRDVVKVMAGEADVAILLGH
jgi:hypothetical protein